jgi:heavy metal translocating P-type ATPase
MAGCCGPLKAESADVATSDTNIEEKSDGCCSGDGESSQDFAFPEASRSPCCSPTPVTLNSPPEDRCPPDSADSPSKIPTSKITPIQESDYQKGCCSPPKARLSQSTEAQREDDVRDLEESESGTGCAKACCSRPSRALEHTPENSAAGVNASLLGCFSAKTLGDEGARKQGFCSEKTPGDVEAIKQGCCSSKPTVGAEVTKQDCCSFETTANAEATKQGCYSAKMSFTENAPKSGCCPSEKVRILDAAKRGCCSPKTTGDKETKATDCCSPSTTDCNTKESNLITRPPAQSLASCADSCCGADDSEDPAEALEVTPKDDWGIDLEKGAAETEHVVVSISGMTCTGCETKLRRTLGTLPAVKNLKTSLILARAEFDLVCGLATADAVVKHLERTTEFKCELVKNDGSSLNLICPSEPLAFMEQQWPDGVTDVQVVGKQTIRVSHDAKIVGARDLVERGWSAPMQLAPYRSDPTLEAGSKHVRHMGLLTIFSAVLTIPVLVMAWAPLPEREIAYGSASLGLATIVQVVIAGPFYPKALKDLVFSRTVEMDLLIVLSTSAAYIFSVVSFGYIAAGKPLSTGDFFETATLLVTIIMIGRYISALARQKAAESISVRSLQTGTAMLVDDKAGEIEIDARLLQYGDIFEVAPESRVPTDGTVLFGSSEVDESMVTGESMPVVKAPKSTVIAGSINGSGTLTVRLTRLPDDNTISTIARMVDEAKLSKPKIQDLADRVASYFVPIVVALTIATFVIWIAIGKAVRKQSGTDATVQALTYAITVLIVSCPCAIGLAVPMVVVIASGVAAQRGVIFKSASSIEVAYKATDVVFDKTGTLTQGQPSVVHEEYFTDDAEGMKSLLLGLIGSVKHPVSTAIATHLRAAQVHASALHDAKSIPGKGVEGTFFGRHIRAGNSTWLECQSHDRVKAALANGLTTFCVVIDDTLVAVYGLRDSLRPDALSTISSLYAAGIAVHILSGDDEGAVRSVASQLDVAVSNYRSRCSPADKLTYIQALQQQPQIRKHSKKPKLEFPTVIFVGDGTNDAPSLSLATIGVHISTGTDVAQSAADVVLVRPHLSGVLAMIAVSRLAVRRIAFNFAWSFVYNVFAVALGAGVFVAAGGNARIPPEFAGLGELVSVLPVIAAAVALRWAEV